MSYNSPEADPRAFFFDEFFGGPEHDSSVQTSFYAFLVRVDNGLQKFTLGLSPANPVSRHLSSQEYRALPGYEIGHGNAEPQDPLQINVPATRLIVRRIKHRQRGASPESILMPSLTPAPKAMRLAEPAVLAGPACLRYPGIPEDYAGDDKRRHYAWPTRHLKISMEESVVPGLFWLSEPSHSQYRRLDIPYIHHGQHSTYRVQLVQRTDVKEYAETAPERLSRTNNSITVRWNVLFWREPIEGMPSPEAAVAFLCLRYILHLPPPPLKSRQSLQPLARTLLPNEQQAPAIFGQRPPRGF